MVFVICRTKLDKEVDRVIYKEENAIKSKGTLFNFNENLSYCIMIVS